MTNGFSDPEIEEAALSAMMQWQECATEAVRRRIIPAHFTNHACRNLFEHIIDEWESGRPFDLVLFTDRLRTAGVLDQIGGAAELTRIWMNTCHSPKVAGYYFDQIEDRFAHRSVISTCNETAKLKDTPGIEGAELKHETIDRLSAIPEPSGAKPTRTFAQAIDDKIQRMEKGEPNLDLVLTGISKLDLNSPLRRGDMPLIAGERKAGKSILAATIVLNVAKQGIPVLYFSLEDREPKVVDRLFAGASRIPLDSRDLDEYQEMAAASATRKLAGLPIFVRDDVFDLTELVAVARQAKARESIGLIVVDYAQLVRAILSRDRRELEVATVSRTLRLLAMELDTPLILLSQLNSDGLTRESRALEQDSTAMWMIKTIPDEPGERTIEIPWQRNAASGVKFKVAFVGNIARVENLKAE